MVKLFDTAHLDENLMRTLSSNEASWIYNGLDCCVTGEIYQSLRAQLDEEDPRVQATHDFTTRKLAPFVEMALRGTLVDGQVLAATVDDLWKSRRDLDAKFQRIMREVFGGELNWNSPTQVKQLLYSRLGLKPIKARNAKGFYAETVGEEALEYLKIYLHVRPIVSMILTLRGIAKSIGFLKTKLDDDGRIRTSYNLAGTNTGRLSSAQSEFGSGTNLQNVDRSLRGPFVSDPGMIMVNIDLEQADARNVGAVLHTLFYHYEAKDIAKLLGKAEWNGPVGPAFASAYLDACESGDLHTTVCNMAWPNLAWPEEVSEWKAYCDGLIMFGQDSYRQISKKLGHGTNYYGQPRTMAKHTRTPTPIIEGFQRNYFGAFPAIPSWHQWIINEVRDQGVLYNLFGRRRHFFGRGTDARTHRQAIAYSPQSTTGEQIDRGLYNVWTQFNTKDVQFLNQVHDSILFQVPVNGHAELIPKILDVMKVTLQLEGGRDFTVPLEAKTGWNWGDFDAKKNPFGLAKWRGTETRERPSPRRRLKDYL